MNNIKEAKDLIKKMKNLLEEDKEDSSHTEENKNWKNIIEQYEQSLDDRKERDLLKNRVSLQKSEEDKKSIIRSEVFSS